VLGSAVSGASSAAAQMFTAKALELLLGGTKLSKAAEDAIVVMQQHFFSDAVPRDFISPLRRTGFYMGKDPFKKAETFAYLGGKIELGHRRLPLLMNMNLKEATTILWDLHCQISLHIMYRRDDLLERSDADHSFVLMYLQESIASALEQICNKPALTNEDVAQLKVKIISGIVEPFHTYIQNTQSSQSSGARRTAIDHLVREAMEHVSVALDRFVTEKPLHTSMESIQQTAQGFNAVLKQLLLAVVLVTREDGEKQQSEKWVLQRKMLLAKAVQGEQDSMLSSLLEYRASTRGYQGSSGVLYKNLFASRVDELRTTPVEQQDMCYFQYILDIFSLTTRPQSEQLEQTLQKSAEQFETMYASLPPSESFLLTDLLNSGVKEIEFIKTAVLLYRQSYELARFMAALQHFMQLVGKLGLYNNPDLHRQLLNLIQLVSTRLDQNLVDMQAYVRQGSMARVGGWLNPIDEMLQQLKHQGYSIAREMQSFQGYFAKIIDPVAMQTEFNKSKTELLQAALGLGHASEIGVDQMEAISKQIGSIQFAHFAHPLVQRVDSDINTHARLTEILAFAYEMQGQLDTAETSVGTVRSQYDKTVKELEQAKLELSAHETELRASSQTLHSSLLELRSALQQAEIQLGAIDKVVEAFGLRIRKQLSDLNTECMRDVDEANRLIATAKNTLTTSTSQHLSDQMTLLARLKGRLEERQNSYQKLVDSVSSFEKEYSVKRGDTTLALTNVHEVARDIDRTVLELMAKINALTEIISSLRLVLEDKDKQLAVQQTKLIELEAQVAQLKNEVLRPSVSSVQNLEIEAESSRSKVSRSVARSENNIGFLQLTNKNSSLSPEYRINRLIERYEMDICYGNFVRNKDRKFIKHTLWCELKALLFQQELRGAEFQTTKELILALIKQVKATNVYMKTDKKTYCFNELVKRKSDEEIYQEFLKGKDTQQALVHLEPLLSQCLFRQDVVL
jgi:hypothetical protein